MLKTFIREGRRLPEALLDSYGSSIDANLASHSHRLRRKTGAIYPDGYIPGLLSDAVSVSRGGVHELPEDQV